LNETRREEIARTRVLESDLAAGLARNDPEATCPDLIGVAGMARGGWAESRGREQRAKAERRGREKEKESIAKPHACFGRKMVYGKFFRKPFSVFYKAIFRSKEKNFR
jgi:hypothetical protein